MAGLLFTVILSVSIISLATGITIPTEVSSFVQHEIVPDVLINSPSEILNITFHNGVQALEGNELTIAEVSSYPTLEWTFQADKFYVLIMCDADAPSREAPEARSFLHWLVVNIPGGDVARGETLTNFISSHPEPHTGLHRYIFLIYEQPEFIDFEEKPSDEFDRRVNFMPERFADKYELGAALAGNFYQTQTIEQLNE